MTYNVWTIDRSGDAETVATDVDAETADDIRAAYDAREYRVTVLPTFCDAPADAR